MTGDYMDNQTPNQQQKNEEIVGKSIAHSLQDSIKPYNEKNGTDFDTVIVEKFTPSLPHEQLLAALFFFWDGFERASMNFFLIRDTARQVMADTNLSGDKLTLGIRRMEWNGGQARVFQAFMEHEQIKPIKKGEDYYLFDYKGVPVYLYVYDENPCLDALDIVFYNNETFNTPNPFDAFCEKYDK